MSQDFGTSVSEHWRNQPLHQVHCIPYRASVNLVHHVVERDVSLFEACVAMVVERDVHTAWMVEASKHQFVQQPTFDFGKDIQIDSCHLLHQVLQAYASVHQVVVEM